MTLQKRHFQTTDIPLLQSWLPTLEDTVQWGGPHFDFPVSEQALRGLIALHAGEEPERECWMVTDAEGETAGHFQLGFEKRSRQAFLGRVILAPERRGRGLALPLTHLAVNQAFARAWVHRIELRVYEHNRSAIAAYRRAGFTLEGVRRECMPVGEAFWNSVVMGLLRREWEMRRKAD
ncbi:MAG: GNAT family N-acetyltransferase [Alphaproteobacteria bacterium]